MPCSASPPTYTPHSFGFEKQRGGEGWLVMPPPFLSLAPGLFALQP